MEVMMPPSSSDNFMFRSTCTSPCTPQSPQNAGNYFFSAPSSPTNSSPFNRQISFAFDAIANSQESDHTHHHSDDIIEDAPVDSANLDHSLAKKYFSFNFYANQDDGDDGDDRTTTKEEDFEFDFTAATQDDGDDGTTKEDFTFPPSVNQLSQGGIIKSLEPLPKKTLQNAVSFRQRKKYSDPCAKSMERVHNSPNYMNGKYPKKSPKALKMVSERVNTKKSCKASSSTPRTEASEQVISMERSSSSTSSSSWLIKWKLPDLLFRSASEGHETKKKYEIEGKNVKMSSGGGSGSNGGSRKKKERVSGHELLYQVNRATAAEMRRKTFLPYKQNLMGCMDNSLILEPSVRGINSSQARRQ